MPHVMLDIETLDTTPTSVVLSVGVCKFDPRNKNEPHAKTLWRPNIEEQTDKGRTVSEATLEWWSKQDASVRESTFTEEGRIPLDQMFKELNSYLTGSTKIWCQGPQFDMVILEDMFRQFNHHTNWSFWQIMDSRTLFNLMPKDPRKDIQQDAHDAAEDAFWQAVAVQRSYAHFRI